MSQVIGKVGSRELTWLSAPRGPVGTARVKIGQGEPVEVSWRRDADGIWIELPYGSFGYDFDGETGDDGRIAYRVSQRGGSGEWLDQAFVRAGEEHAAQAQAGSRKGLRIRAQMPGKILRVLAKPGQAVSKGQALLVMEAMKMENEIKAPVDSTVKECKAAEGQAVETGADLMILEPA
jgi:biotin carboxyl carrier protein